MNQLNNNKSMVHHLFPKPTLQIIIILYNSGKDLDFCLESIVRSLSLDSSTSVSKFQGAHFILDKITLIDNTPNNPPELTPWTNRLKQHFS
jgi:hypothetical protein